MPVSALILAAVAALCLWLALHHGWIAHRRRDLALHAAFAWLAAAIGIIATGELLMQTEDLARMRLGDRVSWIGLLGSAFAMVRFVRLATDAPDSWWPRALSIGAAAAALLWLVKPNGYMGAPITELVHGAAPWGGTLVRPVFPYDWSYFAMLAATVPILAWGLWRGWWIWRRQGIRRGLALVVSMTLIFGVIAVAVGADMYATVTPVLISHSFVGLALIMSHALTDEVARTPDLERRLRHAERFESLGRLASGVAHDFGNILTGIQVAGDFLDERLDRGDAESRQLLDLIRSAGARGVTLNQRLMRFASSANAEPSRLDVHEAIRDVVALGARKHVETELWLNARHHHVHGDPALLTSLLLNLVVNASDAMRGVAGGKLIVSTAVRSPAVGTVLRHPLAGEEHLEIAVTDTGTGIPPEILERIWEPLFTTKGTAGTGLGMPQIDAALTGLGGTVAIETAIGRGTTFRIWLPRHRESQGRRPSTANRSLPILVAAGTRTEAELRAAALSSRFDRPVRAVDPDDSALQLAVVLIAEGAVADTCAAAQPHLPLLILEDGAAHGDLPKSSSVPETAAIEELVAAIQRIIDGPPSTG